MLPRWVKHRNNLWIAMCAAVAPNLISEFVLRPFLAWLFGVDTKSLDAVLKSDTVLLPVVIAAIQGLLYGFAACCCATHPSRRESFKISTTQAVSAAVILTSFYGSEMLNALLGARIPAVILPPCMAVAISRLVTTDNDGFHTFLERERAGRRPYRRRASIGLVPAVLVLLAWGMMFAAAPVGAILGIIAWPISVTCSVMGLLWALSPNRPAAIPGGLAVMLLNGFIAFGIARFFWVISHWKW